VSDGRVLLYVQHLLGIGHLKRAMTLARALAGEGLEVTVASGGFEVPELAIDGVRIVQLPPVRAADMTFKNLVGATGAPIDDRWKQQRRDALLALYGDVDPHVLLIELFPFGRRQMRFELLPLLDMATSRGSTLMKQRPLIVSSVRDVGAAGQQDPSRQQMTLDLVDRYIDRVLVHSDPELIRFERTFPNSEQVARKLHYTGFVVERAVRVASGSDAGRDEVIVSAGGGAVGRDLLETALRARLASKLENRTWRVLMGINAPAEDTAMIEALARQIGGGHVVVERARDDFTTLLANCAVSVSQAGYNTTMEILDAGARAVLVPFAGGAETEQALRATVLAENGRVHVVDESALTPETLAAAIDRAALEPRPKRSAIDLGGAKRSAKLVGQWIAERELR
jgi:predicted glycosyltransferase